ncbi:MULTISPECIES: cytochrome c biogenesis CcdA family protein [unclassified Candidatus Frackibacter]|uniref:cytochrome c biogenesis CcdA family protein n=1 Tax=unclassified Candidatus Frackibacter TaxID=2648818 RepID=UPI000881842F|nr:MULTISPECIES: cytochrome c biogenesis protein CcdA [unclassified Candidatus Frackibacter]SDC53692.1 cytochrome c-type biogenesis protein [Candidatus Frackibacter sp. WG11]SEM66028.1 cytochrome c-type biogenesis protein [Candidatus Frackibacter sp. WG12]SFL77340.1 cytochrome c-type biogenesis protein [Candidatus Frackibacter sp. WG13]
MGEEVNLFIAFSAGLISFLSPCVLPLIPTYITYLSGASIEEMKKDKRKRKSKIKKKLFLNSIMFIFGFSIIFILLGMSATFLGRFMLQNQPIIRKISGIIVIIFGLHMTGLIKIPFFYRQKKVNYQPKKVTPINSLLLGMAFSAGWTPCIGPILSSILIYASSSQTVWLGGGLLGIYALGLAIPFLITTLFISYLSQYLRRLNKHLNKVSIVSGVLLIIMGILIYNNAFQWLSQFAL